MVMNQGTGERSGREQESVEMGKKVMNQEIAERGWKKGGRKK